VEEDAVAVVAGDVPIGIKLQFARRGVGQCTALLWSTSSGGGGGRCGGGRGGCGGARRGGGGCWGPGARAGPAGPGRRARGRGGGACAGLQAASAHAPITPLAARLALRNSWRVIRRGMMRATSPRDAAFIGASLLRGRVSTTASAPPGPDDERTSERPARYRKS